MQQTHSPRREWTRRLLSLALAAVMILGLVPGFPGADSQASAHWAEPYLSQLVEWGFIRADQAGYPDRALTRADFMAIVNRAYGYATPGETPFEDIKESDWYYDDVGIAYNARYIKGTSPTTASPKDPLTRETSATILGRNMMLQESAGEILDFTDARRISNWARGTIKSSLEHYLVTGYDDGTFRPQRNVSWGEMASMISKIVGTPLQEPGDYALGGTFGNVTITSSGVTLRDTVISGDLYVTGGVGLGDVKLENVTVLGRIIASGTGSSEGGEASILLRNVTADEMLIDNLQDNKVSVKADGITEIGRTTVRTSAYIEDNTPDGMGLKYISIEGESYPEGEEPDGWEPIQVDLAGRIGEVVNRTPQSQVRAGRGTVAKLTVDEAAVGSTVIIDRGAVVAELNLDTATEVTGEGDIGHLTVNAPGCVVEMLPDQITIRPGVTAEIAGEEMDTVAAEESSMDPLILAGYPQAQDITPTSLLGAFMTNKSGTVYWAVSPVTEGSVGEDDLIKPPSYGSIAVAHGSVQAPKGNEEFTAAISRLTPGGSYYLSAVLVDARDKRSPVKVISFETPDNTVPAFCAGYPHMSSTSPKNAIAVAMPTKDCKLYYALLPQNTVAPTANEMKTNAVAGALGYGVIDVYKNEEAAFPVNDVVLEEKTTYVLYFWLTDGVNSSPVTSLTFTTKDETPPNFIVEPTVTDVKATSVSMTFRLDEDGIVYWVAVPAGTVYPKPQPGTDYDTAPLDSEYAKLQIISGMNIGSNGKAGRVNAKENTDGTITVSGLKAESAYDFYYVAVDTAGNRGLVVGKKTINTLDTTGPKFTQSFSHVAGTDKTKDPMSDTAIYLDVSENIRYDGEGGGKSLLEIYQDTRTGTDAERTAAVNRLAKCLFGTLEIPAIVLHQISSQDKSVTDVLCKWQTSDTRDEWVIDYTQAIISSRSGGGIRIEFPPSALHLENGASYYFTIENIRDVSNNQNELVPETVDFFRNEAASKAGGHNVPVFEVGMPRVDFSSPGVDDGPLANGSNVRMDLSFRMTPVSTETVSSNLRYDVLLWTGNQLRYDLYYRVVDEQGKKIINENNEYPEPYQYKAPNAAPDAEPTPVSNYRLPQLGANKDNKPDANGWIFLGNSGDLNPTSGHESGRSVNKNFNGCGSTTFPQLRNLSSKLRYEFVIHITQLGSIPEQQGDRETWRNWNQNVVFHVNVAAGQSNNLNSIASDGTATNPGGVTETSWKEALDKGQSGGALSIGRWYDAKNQEQRYIELSYRFSDSRLPSFTGVQFPEINPDSIKVEFRMSTAGTVYWMVGQADSGTNKTAEITTTRRLLSTGEASTNQTDAVANAEATGALYALAGSSNQYHIRLTDKSADSGVSLAPPDPTKGESMQPWMVGTTNLEENPTDDPEIPNLIERPNKNWVMNPSSSNGQVSSDVPHGTMAAQGGRLESFVVENLSPEKNYYLYVVVKGESDTLSHVYLYQFTTPKAVKPKISLTYYYKSETEGGATIKTPNTDSKLQYLVFTLDDAQNERRIPILSEKFQLPTDYTDNLSTENRGIVEADGKITALNAMLTEYLGEDPTKPSTDRGYSLFDIYAPKELKNRMSRFLRGGNLQQFITDYRPDVVVDRSSELSLKSTDVRDQILKLKPATQHVILAVARTPNANSTDDSEVDSYAAYYPLTLGSAKAVEVDTNSWNATFNSPLKTDKYFTGTIMIPFEINNPVYSKPGASDLLTTADLVRIIREVSGGEILTRIQPEVIQNGLQTIFRFSPISGTDGWHLNDNITIFGTYLYSIASIPSTKNLYIDIGENRNGTALVATLKWGNTSSSPNFAFPYGEEELDIRATFKVSEGNNKALLYGEEGAQTLLMAPDARPTLSIDYFPQSPAPSYYWEMPANLSPTTSNNSSVAITSNGTPGTSEITLTLSVGRRSKILKLSVIVTTLSLDEGKTETKDGPIDVTGTGTMTWDRTKGGDASIIIRSSQPLPSSIGPGAVKVVSSDTTILERSTGLIEFVNRSEVKIPLACTHNGKVTLTIEIGPLSCQITVTATGSDTRNPIFDDLGKLDF